MHISQKLLYNISIKAKKINRNRFDLFLVKYYYICKDIQAIKKNIKDKRNCLV